MEIIKGRVWKFGDYVNTDVITPGKYLSGEIDRVKEHVLEALNPNFAREVRSGDIIAAGKNFGCGSSRELAPQALKMLEISAVVADSFARIFFRNAIAIGLPVLTCFSVSQNFKNGDILTLNLDGAIITNLTTGISLKGDPIPNQMLLILNKGGITAVLKEMFGSH
jgi:3-isopropylmalate dehydratase small subunit